MVKIQLATGIENERGREVRQLLRARLVTVFHLQNRGWALLLLLLVGFPTTSRGQASRSAVTYFNRAHDRYLKGDNEGAIADFDIAIKFDPGYAQAYYNRGIALMGNGDLDAAIADFNKAIEIDSRYVLAYDGRANARLSKGQMKEAIADFD
jgi:tetratricopeptide (TPR) repeat protein